MSFFKSLFGQGKSSTPAQSGLVTLEAGLRAYFKQPQGPSRPGVDWKMSLTASPQAKFFVRTYFASGKPSDKEQKILGQRAIEFVSRKMASGWIPNAGDHIEMQG